MIIILWRRSSSYDQSHCDHYDVREGQWVVSGGWAEKQQGSRAKGQNDVTTTTWEMEPASWRQVAFLYHQKDKRQKTNFMIRFWAPRIFILLAWESYGNWMSSCSRLKQVKEETSMPLFHEYVIVGTLAQFRRGESGDLGFNLSNKNANIYK